MADIILTQAEADVLIAMEKHRSDEGRRDFPMGGQSLSLPLHSADRHENFLLDLRRGHIDLQKIKMQNRGRQVVVLVRLDLGGAPHRNPDDEEIPAPHLGDKWAVPLPADRFRNPANMWATFEDFLRFCNITQPPHIQRR